MFKLPKNKPIEIDDADIITMLLLGAPQTGKTTFALGFPEPLWLNTDGNVRQFDTPRVLLQKVNAYEVERDPEVELKLDKLEAMLASTPDTPENAERIKKIKQAKFNLEQEYQNQPSTLSGYQVIRDVVDQIVSGKTSYKTLVIDLLSDFLEIYQIGFLEKYGFSDINGNFGKNRQKYVTEIRDLMTMLNKANVNIIMINHSANKSIKDELGNDMEIIVPSGSVFSGKTGQDLLNVITGRCNLTAVISVKNEKLLDENGMLVLDKTNSPVMKQTRILDWTPSPEKLYCGSRFNHQIALKSIAAYDDLKVALGIDKKEGN